MTPADYAKPIPTHFDLTRPPGLPAYVPPAGGGGIRAIGGAYTLPNLAPALCQDGGTCYAHAPTAAVRYCMNHRSPPLPANVAIPSRTFLLPYMQSSYANGGSSSDYFNLLVNLGGPNEQLWPYLWTRWCEGIVPSPKCFALAIRNSLDPQTSKISEVHTAADACKAIDNGHPVIAYIGVDTGGFATLSSDNCVWNPSSSSYCLLNHAVLIVGYDAVDGGRFLAQNSWGTGWGKNGFFYMYHAYFARCVTSYAYVLNISKVRTYPVHHPATVTVTPGKTTDVHVSDPQVYHIALNDVQSSGCPYNDVHVRTLGSCFGSVQLLFDVVPAGGYLLKLSAFVGPYTTLTVSLDGVERQFRGDEEDYVEEKIAVREVQYAKLVFA